MAKLIFQLRSPLALLTARLLVSSPLVLFLSSALNSFTFNPLLCSPFLLASPLFVPSCFHSSFPFNHICFLSFSSLLLHSFPLITILCSPHPLSPCFLPSLPSFLFFMSFHSLLSSPFLVSSPLIFPTFLSSSLLLHILPFICSLSSSSLLLHSFSTFPHFVILVYFLHLLSFSFVSFHPFLTPCLLSSFLLSFHPLLSSFPLFSSYVSSFPFFLSAALFPFLSFHPPLSFVPIHPFLTPSFLSSFLFLSFLHLSTSFWSFLFSFAPFLLFFPLPPVLQVLVPCSGPPQWQSNQQTRPDKTLCTTGPTSTQAATHWEQVSALICLKGMYCAA